MVVVVHMVVVVLCRCPHGCGRFISLYTWLSSSYVVVHMVVLVLCRCPHGCRRTVLLISCLNTQPLLSHHTCPILSTCREVVKLLTYFDQIDFMDVILNVLQWMCVGNSSFSRLTQRVPTVEQELLTPLEHLRSPMVAHGVRVTRSLVWCVCLIDHCFSFFCFWPFCCLFFFDKRILITPFWSSNFFLIQKLTSCTCYYILLSQTIWVFSKEKQAFGVDKKVDKFLFHNSFNNNDIAIFVDSS